MKKEYVAITFVVIAISLCGVSELFFSLTGKGIEHTLAHQIGVVYAPISLALIGTFFCEGICNFLQKVFSSFSHLYHTFGKSKKVIHAVT
jgi:uncharacterized membrane protein